MSGSRCSDRSRASHLPAAAPATHSAEFNRMLIPARPYDPSASRFTVSMENVDIVVNAPKKPVKTSALAVSPVCTPQANMRYDAAQQPMMLTRNVASGNGESTAW